MPKLTRKSRHFIVVFNSLNIGGIERKIIDITNYFSQQKNIKVTLLLKTKTGPLLNQLSPKVSVISPITGSSKIFNSLYFPIWLAIQFSRLHPHLILSFGNYSAICSLIAQSLVFPKPPLIVSEDSSITTQIANDTFPLLRRFLVKTLYPHASKIITLTSQGAKKLAELSPPTLNKLVTIPNWLPLNFTKGSPKTYPRNIDLLFLGRFEPQKDPLMFLKICKALVNYLPTIQISMFGQGSLESQIKNYITHNQLTKNISLHPATLDTPEVFQSSRIMLLTSVHEGFPLTILESTASGCLPVCRSIPEIVPFFFMAPEQLLFNSPTEAIETIKYLLSHQTKLNFLSTQYQKRSYEHQLADFKKTINLLNSFL